MTEKSIIWTDETIQLWCELKEAMFDLDKACIYDIAERMDRVRVAMRDWEEVVYKEESDTESCGNCLYYKLSLGSMSRPDLFNQQMCMIKDEDFGSDHHCCQWEGR